MKQTFLHIRINFRWYVLVFLMLCSLVLWYVVFHEDQHGLLTFAVLDIGQGDALFVESPTGMKVLIDGGPGNALSREISHVLPWYDRHIDMIVVTNPDKDHYEGFLSLLKNYSVDVELESGTISPTGTYAALEKEIKDKNIPQIIGKRGQIIDIGGGAYMQVLFPDRSVASTTSNDGSLVMRLVYGDTSVALQGDSTIRIEDYLISLDGSSLKSTILKVGHHGSKTSSSEAYVKVVEPQWAVMSSGIGNRYGHPQQETLDIFSKFHIPTLDTCVMGNIIFHSNGNVFTLQNKTIPTVTSGCPN